ncbi:MAG: cell division protein FtsZ [Oscillospiraceae bacterium]|jgi:cell division protein FtsZ|nr:cell division protein FtsZ [Oscillospiraceae bacterium]
MDMTGDFIRIKVIGVGGAGNNVVSRMTAVGTGGISYANINTDKAALAASTADELVQIGEKLTHGQGAGANPAVGRMAAEESRNAIEKVFADTDAVFITAGMGGGTGTGAAPVVAGLARDADVLTIAVVTKPFKFEGRAKMEKAEEGISSLLENVDTLFVIPNENLKKVTEQKITFANAFETADGVLNRAVSGIAEILRQTGFINLDFADLTNTLKRSGLAHLGVGEASGKEKVNEVAEKTIYSELTETSVNGAKRVIISVTGSMDLTMDDVDAVVGKIEEAAHPDANIIFGVNFDENLTDAMRVIVIATDFGDDDEGSASSGSDASEEDDEDGKWQRFLEETFGK